MKTWNGNGQGRNGLSMHKFDAVLMDLWICRNTLSAFQIIPIKWINLVSQERRHNLKITLLPHLLLFWQLTSNPNLQDDFSLALVQLRPGPAYQGIKLFCAGAHILQLQASHQYEIVSVYSTQEVIQSIGFG